MPCSIDQLKHIADRLLKQGYSEEEVTSVVTLISKRDLDSDLSKKIDSLVTNPITTEDQDFLRKSVATMIANVDKVVTGGSILRLDELLSRVLPAEDVTRVKELIKKIRIADGNVDLFSISYIEDIDNLIEMNRNLGRESILPMLFDRRDKAVQKMNESRRYEDTKEGNKRRERDEALNKINQLKHLLNYVEYVINMTTPKGTSNKVKRYLTAKEKIKSLQKSLKTERSLVKRFKAGVKGFKETNQRIKELEKELSDAKQEEQVAFEDIVNDKFLELSDGKKTIKLKSVAKAQEQIKNAIEREAKKVDGFGVEEISKLTAAATKSLAEKLVQERIASRNIKATVERMNKLVDFYEEEKEKAGETRDAIDHIFMGTIVGKAVVERWLRKNRTKKAEDGSMEVDRRPLSVLAAKDIINEWKALAWFGVQEGTFSDDVATAVDSELALLESMVNSSGVANPLSMDVNNMRVKQDRTGAEAAMMTNIGVIPEENKAQTARQLSSWLEYTIRGLYSLRASPFYNGTVTSKAIDMVLHPKLYDLTINSDSLGLVSGKKRKMNQPSKAMYLGRMKELLKDLGIEDPESLPEFKPDFSTNRNAISYDIETDPVDKGTSNPTKIISMQIRVQDIDSGAEPVSYVFTNADDSKPPVNNLTVDGPKKPLTKQQIEWVLRFMEEYQNKGFKLVTFAGNSFDLGKLNNPAFVDDAKLVTRIALRSYDLQRNLGFHNKERRKGGKYFSSKPKNAGLKSIAKNNLPDSRTVTEDGRYVVTNGAVYELGEGGVEVEILGKEAEENFNKANLDNDWAKFNLYADNDVITTLDLFNYFITNAQTNVSIVDEIDSGLSYSIMINRPQSNMMLPLDDNNTNSITFSELMSSFTDVDSRIKEFSHDVEYVEEMDINLDKLISLLETWYIQALSMDPESKDKLNQLQKALTDTINTETIVQQTGKKVADRMAKAVKESAKENFARFGYVLAINTDENGNPRLDTEDEHSLFLPADSETVYVENLVEAFVDALKTSRSLDSVEKEMVEKFNIRSRQQHEEPSVYFQRFLTQVLNTYFPINALSDFGNGNVDWHPARDVGVALAHVFTNRKEGMSLVDVKTMMGTQGFSGRQFAAEEATNRGVPRFFLLDGTNFASPWGITEEALIYDNFRLLSRMKDIMERDLTEEEMKDIEKWATTKEDSDPEVALSVFRRGAVPTVFPKVTSRAAYDFLPSLSERELMGQEFLFDIPRLMMFINHDAFYTPLAQKGRWLQDGSIYYAEDFFTAGAPTAKMILSGAIDHIAWLVSFDKLNPNNKNLDKVLRKALSDGIDAVIADPTVQDSANKNDYSYHGVHIQLMLLLSASGEQDVFDKFLEELTKKLDTEQEADVRKNFEQFKKENDPRNKLNDMLIDLLEQAKNNREQFKGLFNLSEDQTNAFLELLPFLEDPTPKRKEFLKGIITPSMYSAGYQGIFKGILAKADSAGLTNITERHASVVAKIVTNKIKDENARYVDKAIGIYGKTKQGKDKKQVIIDVLWGMSARIDEAKIKENAFKNFNNEVDAKKRIDSAVAYLKTFIRLMVDQSMSKAGKNEDDIKKEREAKINELSDKYQERMNKAAAIMAKHDMRDPDVRNDPKIQDEINIALMGDKRSYHTHLMLHTIARRAATPFKLLADKETMEMHSAYAGQHIDEADVTPFMSKTLFNAMGLELASGRHHMFGNYEWGPQGSKAAQIRVLHGSDKNELGIWDIEEVYKNTERNKAYREAYVRQIMLDLAPNYYPPGYDPETESMESFFDAMNKRSRLERAAQVRAQNTLDINRIIDRNDPNARKISDTAEKLEENNFKSRLGWIRGNYQRDRSKPIVLDPTVSGLAALRPRHANIDYTQRGMYALIGMMKTREIEQTEMFKRNKLVQEAPKDGDPNNIIPKTMRGFVKTTDKRNMPYVPHQSGNMITSLTISPNREVEIEAVRLRNTLTNFAVDNGLEDMLKKGEWTRLWMIKEWRRQGLEGAIYSMKNQNKSDLSSMMLSRIKMYEAIFKLMGTNARAYSPEKTYSTLDLMAKPEDVSFTADEIDELRKNFPDGLRYLDLLRHISGRFDRLTGLANNRPLVAVPGIIARGNPGLIVNEPALRSLSAFSIENNNNISMMLIMTDVFQEEAEKEYKDDPSIPRDSAGNIALSMIPADKNKSMKIFERVLARANDVASEWGTRKDIVMVFSPEQLEEYNNTQKEVAKQGENQLTLQMPLTSSTHVFNQVSNPDTLWYFTPDMVIQFLNSLRNDDPITNYELGWQTRKTVGFVRTDADILVMEEQNQLMDNLGRSVDLSHQALVLLHTLDPSPDNNTLLYQNNYRKLDNMGNPTMTLDATAYLGSSFEINLEIDGTEQSIAISLETAMFATDILSAITRARKLGMYEEANKLSLFLYNELTEPSVDISKDATKINPTKDIVIKAAVLKSRLDGLNNVPVYRIREIIMSTLQTEISAEDAKNAFEMAHDVSRLIQKIADTNPDQNQKMNYVANALLSRREMAEEGVENDSSLQGMIIQAVGAKDTPQERSKAMRALYIAQQDLSTVPEDRPFGHLPWDARKDVARFADQDEFIRAFGDSGRGIVDQLNGMVSMGYMSRRVADMKMILIGSLAIVNPDILSDLSLDASEFDGQTYARMAKQNGKYSIGVNIKAMETTPENEMLLKFAEELVHLARVKYMADGSEEYKRIQAVFRLPNSEGMIREMLLAMHNGKPYAAIEQDVQYAMDNTDEFLAHWGAVVLLSETVYSPDTLVKLEAKYAPVEMTSNWFKRAFFKIKNIAIRALNMMSQMSLDRKYSDSFNEMYDVMQGLIGQGLTDRRDVGNPDMAFNAVFSIKTDQVQVTPGMYMDMRVAVFEKNRLNGRIRAGDATPADETQLRTIEDTLNDPKANPLGIMGMTLSQVVEEMENISRSESGNIVRIKNGSLANRAILQKAMTHYFGQRGTRVDNSGTLGGTIRNMFRGADDFISLQIQNRLLQSFNNSNLTYNSPEAILVFISDAIDNTAVTTQSSYMPSQTQGGFEAHKEGLKLYVNDIIHTALGIQHKHKEQANIDAIHRNAGLIAAGLPLDASFTNPDMIEDAKRLGNKIKLFNNQLRSKLVESRIKDTGDNLDAIGLKLVKSTQLEQEQRDMGYNAVVNAMRAKYLNNLDNDRLDSIVNPFMMYIAGLLVNPSSDKNSLQSAEFRNEIIKFTKNPNNAAINAKEASIKNLVNMAMVIRLQKEKQMYPSRTIGDIQTKVARDPFYLNEEIIEASNRFIVATRENSSRFNTAFNNLTNTEIQLIHAAVREVVATREGDESSLVATRIKEIKSNKESFGYYQGKSNYYPRRTDLSNPMFILADQFLGKLGSTAYLFLNSGPDLTYADIFLNPIGIDPRDQQYLQRMFDDDIPTIQQSLMRGQGYDAIQRIIVQKMTGIEGAYFSISQLIDMFETEVQARGLAHNNMRVQNFDNRRDDHREQTLLNGLQKLRVANSKAKEVLGVREENQPLIDAINKYGPIATTLAYGPNAALATTLVEGTMGALESVLQGAAGGMATSPITFLFEAFKMNMDSSLRTVQKIVDRRDGRTSFFNVDPYLLSKTAENALWMMEETTSPQIPGQLTVNALSADEKANMNTFDRFMAFSRRAYSDPMRSLRVAAENQANRGVVERLRDGSLVRLRDSVNRILRDNPSPSNEVLREVLRDAGVRMDVELMLIYVRSGIFVPGRIEALQYTMSQAPTKTNRIMYQVMADIEADLRLGTTYDGVTITPSLMHDARLSMATLSKAYANLSIVMDHPLDGTAASDGLSVVLTFYKSYPTLFMAQQIYRRGSVAPAFRHGIRLLTHAMLDMIYNILLALASGWYKWEELMERIEKGNINYTELAKLVLRYPVFSMNKVGLVSQLLVTLATDKMNKNSIISSVGEQAIINTFFNMGKAVESYYYWATGQVSKEHPGVATYAALRGFLSAVPGNTLIRIILEQSFGQSGTTGTATRLPAALMRQVDMVSDERPMKEFVRTLFPDGVKNKKPTVKPMKLTDIPKIRPLSRQTPKTNTPTTKSPSIKEQATTPLKAPSGF